MFAISAIVKVQHIKVAQVPVLTGLLLGWLFGNVQERAEESR
jgi:hypothetical protein